MPRDCLQFVIVVFSDHTHLLFLIHWSFSFGMQALTVGTLLNVCMKDVLIAKEHCIVLCMSLPHDV